MTLQGWIKARIQYRLSRIATKTARRWLHFRRRTARIDKALLLGIRQNLAVAGYSVPKSRTVRKVARAMTYPAIVEVETVNICNALCTFCVYRDQIPKKKLMDQTMFASIAEQVDARGTDQWCLEPMLGDPLLDERIVEFASYLRQTNTNGQIRTVTNGLAFDRFSDQDVQNLMEALDLLEISIGPNEAVYREMFGVNRFEHLIGQLERLCKILENCHRRPRIWLAGRACGDEFIVDDRLDEIAVCLTGRAHIEWTREYMDWGGKIRELPLGTEVQRADRRSGSQYVPCTYSLSPHVYYDGRVGLCACAGATNSLEIGDLNSQSWNEIMSSNRRTEMILGFLKGTMPDYCKKCSFYSASPDDVWADFTEDAS